MKKKTKVKMNKLVYLGMSILDITKTLMYKCWCEYIKRKYGYREKLCCNVTRILIALLFISKLKIVL